jgi:hemerythrin-like domain-containing protein
MKATEILSAEHRVIERVMSALETGANRVEEGITVRPGFFIQATDFIKGFADGCHHRKEEGVLFPALAANGMPVENGPVGVMLAEHEQGRDFTRKLRAAALAWEGGDASAKSAVIENARGYAQLLKQHIFKEDHVLFPAADRVIPAEKQDAVMEGFEHVEHEETGEGVHEKYLAMAQALEQEIK